MLMSWILGVALAGVVGVGDGYRVHQFDTRAFRVTPMMFIPPEYEYFADFALDSATGRLILEAYGFGFPDCMLSFDPLTGDSYCLPVPFSLGVAHGSAGGIEYREYDVEYFPPLDLFLTLYSAIESVDEFNNRRIVAQLSPGFPANAVALAWDADLNLLWTFSETIVGPNMMALEPTTFTPVAYGVGPIYGYTATGLYDNTPAQTPILFVSGTCPGELLVTVADATPGDTVEIVSGTRRGRTSAAGGRCGGARADLANAQRRATLTADSYGLATTRLQATAPMCGTWMLQALDAGSCLTTEVRPVPAAVVP